MATSPWCSCCSVDKQQLMLQSLHVTASSGHAAIVQALLDTGGAVDALDAEGNTALYLAVQMGHTAVVKQLLCAEPG
jgi:ankyrin repeat protein